MSLVAKFLIAIFTISLTSVTYARNIYILTIGQSSTIAHDDCNYENEVGVYKIDQAGNITPYLNSRDWADCKNGLIWMSLGKKMISSGFAERVIFMPVNLIGNQFSYWLPKGEKFNELEKALKITTANSIKFDYAIWHQESYNTSDDKGAHGNNLLNLLKFISINFSIEKWLISGYSNCKENYSKEIEFKQREIGSSFTIRRFRGPSLNELGPEYRIDACNLNKNGYEKITELWYSSIKTADSINNLIQKETLLKYFRN